MLLRQPPRRPLLRQPMTNLRSRTLLRMLLKRHHLLLLRPLPLRYQRQLLRLMMHLMLQLQLLQNLLLLQQKRRMTMIRHHHYYRHYLRSYHLMLRFNTRRGRCGRNASIRAVLQRSSALAR